MTGIDVATNQIVVAKARAEAEGLSERCNFFAGRAEDTGLPAGSFDRELQALLTAHCPTEPFSIPHRVWLVVGRRR